MGSKSDLRALLAWYQREARDLPWRRTLDPYAIWVSEIMLQQTQVKTVIPYWQRWMRKLPTLIGLAKARPQRVLKLWEGLGYYSRARNLQRAARLIVAEYRGRMPRTPAEWLRLPGVGPSTAGAICSIAFNQPAPILDGNVIRVLSRRFGISENPRLTAGASIFWETATRLIQAARLMKAPGQRRCAQLNQALMELGALICTPSNPRCSSCPLRPRCVARREQRVDSLPALGPRIHPVNRRQTAFVLENQGRFLVGQRPANQINGGLWEFPNVENGRRSSDLNSLASDFIGFQVTNLRSRLTLKHSVTRFRIALEVYSGQVPEAKPAGDFQWRSLAGLKQLPFAGAHRKIRQWLVLQREHRVVSRRGGTATNKTAEPRMHAN